MMVMILSQKAEIIKHSINHLGNLFDFSSLLCHNTVAGDRLERKDSLAKSPVFRRLSMADFYNTISEAVQSGDDKKVAQTVEEALKQGISAADLLDNGLVPGIQALGQRFKNDEVYLPEVLISARAMNRGVEILKPLFVGDEIQKQGTVVVGTIEGDLHDIGKNLVKLMLESNGFLVVDAGVDVPAANFADVAREHKADIVGVSSLLTLTMTAIPQVIDALKNAGLRDKTRVMIGGAPVTKEFADSIEADGFAADCVSAVDEAKRLMAMK